MCESTSTFHCIILKLNIDWWGVCEPAGVGDFVYLMNNFDSRLFKRKNNIFQGTVQLLVSLKTN